MHAVATTKRRKGNMLEDTTSHLWQGCVKLHPQILGECTVLSRVSTHGRLQLKPQKSGVGPYMAKSAQTFKLPPGKHPPTTS